MDTPDYYAMLGVAEDADLETLRKAYKALVFSCHPDVNPGDPAAAGRFTALAGAFAVLADPARRTEYDRWRRRAAALTPFGGVVPRAGRAAGDAFFVAPQARARRRGADVRWNLDIPEAVARRGGGVHFDFGLTEACPRCDGSGSLRLACWVCRGRGSIQSPLGPVLLAEPCPACAGRGVFAESCPACAGKGRRLRPRRGRVVIAPGTATGDVLVVAGLGEPGLGGGPAGDLLLVARVFPVLAGEMA